MAEILVVEDNAAVRMAYRLLLKAAGHGVSEAADGDEAIAKLGAWGVILGRSHIMVTSALASFPPLAAIRSAAWRRNRAESASFQVFSLGGKCRPISPSASAP